MMYAASAIRFASDLTFGHGTAQFRQLIAVMAVVSIVLWTCVVATILLRLWICRVWYRRHYQSANRTSDPPT